MRKDTPKPAPATAGTLNSAVQPPPPAAPSIEPSTARQKKVKGSESVAVAAGSEPDDDHRPAGACRNPKAETQELNDELGLPSEVEDPDYMLLEAAFGADAAPHKKKEYEQWKIKKALEEHELQNPPPLCVEVGSFADEAATPAPWLVPEVVSSAGMTVVAGDPGIGKSKVVMDIVASVTTGRPVGDRGPTQQGEVLMILSEDDPRTIVEPRLHQQGADLSRVRYHRLGAETNCQRTLDLLTDRRLLTKRLDNLPNARLVVVDSLDSFLAVKDPNLIRVGLSRLTQLFESRGIAFIAVAPLRRSENKSPSDILAELPFASLATGVWHVQPDYRYPNRRRVVGLKQKMADAPDMEYELDAAGKLIWLPSRDGRFARRRVSVLEKAILHLVAELETGPKSATHMVEYMEASGFKQRTIERAKQKLDIRSESDGKAWYWRLEG